MSFELFIKADPFPVFQIRHGRRLKLVDMRVISKQDLMFLAVKIQQGNISILTMCSPLQPSDDATIKALKGSKSVLQVCKVYFIFYFQQEVVLH